MIIWFSGQAGAGKTECASYLADSKNTIWLDADQMRRMWKLGYSKEDRERNCHLIAQRAKEYEDKGFTVIVSAIAPYLKLRGELIQKYNIKFICIDPEGRKGREDDEQYEYPNDLQFKILIQYLA